MKRFGLIFSMIFIILTISACVVPVSQIEVKYVAGEGGTIVGDSTQNATSPDGGVTFEWVEAVPSPGYRFVAWSDGLLDTKRSDTLTESATFTAIFERLHNYSLLYTAGEGGKIVGASYQGKNEAFTGTEVTAVADDGYKFVAWSDGLKLATRTDKADVRKELVATFVKVHKITFDCDTSRGIVSGPFSQMVDDGNETIMVIALPRVGYKFSHWSNGLTDPYLTFVPTKSEEIEAVFVREDLSLPVLSIDTENGKEIVSRKDYIFCDVSVSNTDNDYSLLGEGAKIRGRGNTSWEAQDKKPYKLKFNYKVDLLGGGKARDWVLVPNNTDLSLSRNYLAQSVASLFESINSTTNVQFVELFLNGEYCGVYLICEQIEFANNRIEVNESEDIDTSYLIELDGRGDGNYFTLNGKNYIIKEPDTDEDFFTSEHEEFIKNYLTQCLDLLSGDNYDAVCEAIDVRSFAEAYIVYELFKCVDVGFASFNMYKGAGGKLYCGSVWDFDRSLGIVGNTDGAKAYDTLWARQENPWFNALLGFEEFDDLVSEILNSNKDEIRAKLDSCYTYLYANQDSFERNFKRWNLLGSYVWPNDDEICALETWELQVEYTRTYLNSSLDYMLSIYVLE